MKTISLLLVAVVASVGNALIQPQTTKLPTASNGYVNPKVMPYEDSVDTAVLQKIMKMQVHEIENELRDKYGQVFCNNQFSRSHKEDLAIFLEEVRRTKQPVSYDEMPIIEDGNPGSWINDKSGDFFRV